MVVQHNLQAMNSNRMLGITQGTLAGSTEKLSSGYKINRAADNAAGLAISEKMRKQIRGLTQASANAEDGISVVQTAEGALAEVHDMLQRMNELAVQAANSPNSEDDRSYIQDEIDQLTQEIDRVAETTKFNETYLLKGDTTNKKAGQWTYSYAQVTTATKATAQIKQVDTATQLNASVSFNEADGKKVTVDDSNNLAKAIRDQGLTISTFTLGKDATTNKDKIAYSVELNGSDAKANYKVITKNNGADGVTNASFEIVNAKNEVVATITLTDGMTEATAGRSQVVTAYTATAAYAKNEAYALYDKDGNAIAANKLEEYFTSNVINDDMGVAAKGKDNQIFANAGAPKIYDALGQELDATKAVKLISAIKDRTADLKMSFHVGADGTDNNKININIGAMNAKGLGINGLKVDGTDTTKATDAVETISAAVKKVSTLRSALGAVQNRLQHTINNLDNIVENTTSAESAIRDTDMADEMVKYSNSNILSQAGQSMLAQANQSNQGVLSLLG